MLYPVILTLLSAAALAQEISIGENPAFCADAADCPQFKLICETEKYQARRYEPSVWVATDVESLAYEHAAVAGFRKLLKYIKGDNDAMQAINMTAPVLVKVPHGGRFWQKTKYTVYFMLPAKVADNPPSPFNHEVYFERMPTMNVFVKSFGGWILTVTSKIYSGLLASDLKETKSTFDEGVHYMAAYNSPSKFLNRHNEVWYVTKEQPNCEG